MEPHTASVSRTDNPKVVLGDVACDLTAVNGPIHLLGIGGIGMSGLARLLLAQGRQVSGSDKQASEITAELSKMGAQIYIGHRAANAQKAAAIVVSTAITEDNPELKWALEHRLPIWHRSRLLSALAERKKVVAISGTHGKTTTTGMIGQILLDCGKDPSVVIGGVFSRLGSNAISGCGNYFVAEADESDGSHASFVSDIAVVTNVEGDHLENYAGGLKQIYETMTRFANNAKVAVLCFDDSGCQAILSNVKSKLITYGRADSNSSAAYQLHSLPGFSLRVLKDGKALGVVELSVPGEHNKLNALAAVAVGLEFGLGFTEIAQSLHEFAGVDRRFQLMGSRSGITVFDDYAHHPTEIAAMLAAARQYIKGQPESEKSKRVVAVFQPHQPGRLKDFWHEFLQAFGDADLVLISDVYIARGMPIAGVDSQTFAKAIKHPNCKYIPGPIDELASCVMKYLEKGDMVITVGAGDITKVGPQIIELL